MFFCVLGNVVNIQTGQWVSKQSGLGAGMDSFYEYLLKSYILFGEKEDYRMFQAAYESIQSHLRRGWVQRGQGVTPKIECVWVQITGCVGLMRQLLMSLCTTWNMKPSQRCKWISVSVIFLTEECEVEKLNLEACGCYKTSDGPPSVRHTEKHNSFFFINNHWYVAFEQSTQRPNYSTLAGQHKNVVTLWSFLYVNVWHMCDYDRTLQQQNHLEHTWNSIT